VNDVKVRRWSGAAGLAAIALFFMEFPFYLVRGTFPPVTETLKLTEFAARNATNIMICVFWDFLILTMVTVFAAGLQDLIRRADPRMEWIGILFFGVSLVYVTLTLIADSLQAATVVDALTPPADGSILRSLWESAYLMYGSVALFLMAVMMAVAGYAGVASGALPSFTGWIGYAGALSCLAFVPSMFVKHVDPSGFYNPAGWGPTAIASGFPLAVWMISDSIIMLRMSGPAMGGTREPSFHGRDQA